MDGPFATNQSAACRVVMGKNNQSLFVTNTASDNVTSLKVSYFGKLRFANSGNTAPAASTPIDAAVDKDAEYLYVLATGNNAILSYSVGRNGQLNQIDTDDDNLPDRMSGLVVRSF